MQDRVYRLDALGAKDGGLDAKDGGLDGDSVPNH